MTLSKIFSIVFVLNFWVFNAQQQKETISIDLENISIEMALKNIESQSGYKVYYNPKWFQNTNLILKLKFENAPLNNILASVLQKSKLNFVVLKKEIIITENSIIRAQLPDNFFGNQEVVSPSILSENPVFFDKSDANDKNSALIFIGKESKNAVKSLFTISGFVRDDKSNGAISDVIVKIRNNKIIAKTDKDGKYSIQAPFGSNSIEFEFSNYKKITKSIVVYDDGNLDIVMSNTVYQLNEVVVKSNSKRAIEKTISGMTSIDIEKIKVVPLILGERDIFKIATTFPGIKTAGEGSSGYNVRGGKEDQNLILLDNAVLYNPAHFLGFFSAVNPYTTQKADIYKGSIPAEFGGRLSSVFDITSKTVDLNKISGEGGVGPVTSNLAFGIPIVKGKSSLLMGGRATYSNWILRSLKEPTLQNSKASFYDGIAKYHHVINKNNTVEATGYYSKDEFSITSDSVFSYSNRLATLKWNHTFTTKNKMMAAVTNSDYKFNIDYNGEGVTNFDFGFAIRETQFMLKFNYQRNKKHRFSYGITSKLYDIDPGFLTPKGTRSLLLPVTVDSEKALESGIYIADDYKISDKISINVGLRYSSYLSLGPAQKRVYQDNLPLNDVTVTETKSFTDNQVIKNYAGFEPRLALKYDITDDFSLKAGFDKNYQYIHLLSNTTTVSPTDTWKLSDGNVKPQEANQYSFGLYKDLLDETFELSIESYYKTTRNILDYKVGAELLLNTKIETQLLQGEGKAYGLEFLLKKDKGKLNGWISYTYSRSFVKLDSDFNEEKVNNGAFFASNFDKPHDLSIVSNYKLTKRYSLSANFVYQTGRPVTYPIGKFQFENSEYTLYSDRNKFRIPDFYRLDLGVNIEGNHKIKKLAHSFWNISVYNVLGRNNPYSVFFVTKDNQVKGFKTSIFGVPIPTITYNFKF